MNRICKDAGAKYTVTSTVEGIFQVNLREKRANSTLRHSMRSWQTASQLALSVRRQHKDTCCTEDFPGELPDPFPELHIDINAW
ncbi:hypothetical protein [Rathayibacter soli]|uniref:hypothetical protein n=1 Tax=Rathayibacter soli TaxID=3144168 RepID=UPI0027E5025C|nr:hypothetical protein [Glaciibacter superstes]